MRAFSAPGSSLALFGPTQYLDALLQCLAAKSYAFSIDSICDSREDDPSREQLREALLTDSGFVRICSGTDGEYFISRSSLDRWFAWLNTRLASAEVYSLSMERFLGVASGLRECGRWTSLEESFLASPRRVGLVFHSPSKKMVVFPLARLLSHLSIRDLNSASDIITTMLDSKKRRECLSTETVHNVLTGFPERDALVIQLREGLRDRKQWSLEEVGRLLGVTRERVRQMEVRFWEYVRGGGSRRLGKTKLPDPLRFLIAYFIESGGRLILVPSTDTAATIRFVCKCLGVPLYVEQDLNLMIVGIRHLVDLDIRDQASSPDSSVETLGALLTEEAVSEELALECGLCHPSREMKHLVQKILSHRTRSLRKVDKVALALRQLGKPSHYSKVAEQYNRMFPFDVSSENSVHATLSREERGVVWLGVRGTFALREWGYERPKKSLFDSVEEIVVRHFQDTGQPVPFDVVRAEIGRYRRVVNPSSLYMAAFLNPNLSYTGQLLVPRRDGSLGASGVSLDDKTIDGILADYEKKIAFRQLGPH